MTGIWIRGDITSEEEKRIFLTCIAKTTGLTGLTGLTYYIYISIYMINIINIYKSSLII